VLALNIRIFDIFEIGQTDALQYMATELHQGETLRRPAVANENQNRRSAGHCDQVAMALEAAHTAGIIHRGHQAENVMLREDRFVRDRFVKVLDFGLAKLMEPKRAARIRRH